MKYNFNVGQYVKVDTGGVLDHGDIARVLQQTTDTYYKLIPYYVLLFEDGYKFPIREGRCRRAYDYEVEASRFGRGATRLGHEQHD